jgi:hypothetical protein
MRLRFLYIDLPQTPLLRLLCTHRSLGVEQFKSSGLGGSPPNPPSQGTAASPEPPPEEIDGEVENALRIAAVYLMECFCSERRTQ